MRVALSGGGTGGHIMPALAVAERLKERNEQVELLYIGAVTGIETKIVPPLGIPFQAVTTEKLRKTLSLSSFKVALSLLKGYREARHYLRAYSPDIVIGTGGYVAAATVYAAHRLRIPTLIHEGNLIPGRTNLMLSKFATRIGVTFPDTVSQFPARKTVVTGFPIRASIVPPASLTPPDARAFFPHLKRDGFTLFVTGGSQGARMINETVLSAAPQLIGLGVNVLHHTGTRHHASVTEQATHIGLMALPGYQPIAFLNGEEMAHAYRASDLLLCRGGISTIAESLANRVPPMIVPLPSAYADHQTHNARAVERARAGLLLPESELTPAVLIDQLRSLIAGDRLALAEMRQSGASLDWTDAAEQVACEAEKAIAEFRR